MVPVWRIPPAHHNRFRLEIRLEWLKSCKFKVLPCERTNMANISGFHRPEKRLRSRQPAAGIPCDGMKIWMETEKPTAKRNISLDGPKQGPTIDLSVTSDESMASIQLDLQENGTQIEKPDNVRKCRKPWNEQINILERWASLPFLISIGRALITLDVLIKESLKLFLSPNGGYFTYVMRCATYRRYIFLIRNKSGVNSGE